MFNSFPLIINFQGNEILPKWCIYVLFCSLFFKKVIMKVWALYVQCVLFSVRQRSLFAEIVPHLSSRSRF